jgi:Ca2+-binding EF-hand superfamily protein
VQVALFALGFDSSDLGDTVPEVLGERDLFAVKNCDICEAEFITKMRLLLSKSDPIEEILTAFDYFSSDESGDTVTNEISLAKLQKVSSEFNIRLSILELQEMIR